MELTYIQTRIRDFINADLLDGQGDDLTYETPLLECGILDSFALFKLIAFVATEFRVTIPLESLTAGDFESVTAIAKLVRSKISDIAGA